MLNRLPSASRRFSTTLAQSQRQSGQSIDGGNTPVVVLLTEESCETPKSAPHHKLIGFRLRDAGI